MNAKTVSVEWLNKAAASIEAAAAESLPTWILLGQAARYSEDMGKAAALRRAATIKSVAERREFLRSNGVSA